MWSIVVQWRTAGSSGFSFRCGTSLYCGVLHCTRMVQARSPQLSEGLIQCRGRGVNVTWRWSHDAGHMTPNAHNPSNLTWYSILLQAFMLRIRIGNSANSNERIAKYILVTWRHKGLQKVHQPIPPIPEPVKKSPQPQDSALDLWYLIYDGRWTIVVKCCEYHNIPSIHYASFPSIWNNMASIST